MRSPELTASVDQISKSHASRNISGIKAAVAYGLLLIASPNTAIALDESASEKVTTDHCDLIEINHFYDDQGRLVFDQIIYYDWCSDEGRHQVRDWRLLKSPNQVPLRDWKNGGYTSEWKDFKQGDGLRRVTSKYTRESWTQYDPELVERESLEQEKRCELTRIPVINALNKIRGRLRQSIMPNQHP